MASKLVTFVILALALEYVTAGTFLDFDNKNVCLKPGPTCKECNKVVNCVEDGAGGLTEVEVNTCEAKFMCSEGRCVPGACEDTYELACTQSGIFPHPQDCTKYIMCYKKLPTDAAYEKSVITFCEDGYKFDRATLLCTNRAIECDPLPICRAAGGVKTIPQHPKLYYQCISVAGEVKMTMGYCGGNLISHNDQCWNPNNPDLNEVGMCKGIGRYYHPDCKKYFECSGAGKKPSIKSCSTGQYYKRHDKICNPFTC